MRRPKTNSFSDACKYAGQKLMDAILAHRSEAVSSSPAVVTGVALDAANSSPVTLPGLALDAANSFPAAVTDVALDAANSSPVALPGLALDAANSFPAAVTGVALGADNSCFEIRNVEGRGRGLFVHGQARTFTKGDLLTPYDGPRRDSRNGSVCMHCSRVTNAIAKLSAQKQAQISKLQFTKTWAVSVNRQRSCRVVVDGTISASPILDDVPNRAGIGLAAVANSSEGTGSFIINTMNT
jgi:hypothetical protein